MKKSKGFTLIELMVVLSIVAVLATMAAPSLKRLLQSTAMSSNVNTFLADMRYARSESIRRGGGVVMCRTNFPETTQVCNGSDGGSNGWVTGWIIFHDLNSDGAKTADEPVLRVQGSIASIDSIVEKTASPSYKFRFAATGRLPLSSATTLQFGSNDMFSNAVQRTVCINKGGYARIAGDGYASCS